MAHNPNFGSKSFGLEQVANEALIVLKNNINDSIDTINANNVIEDQRIATALSKTYVPCNLEHVNNLEVGEGKSIIDEFYDCEVEFPRVNVITSTAKDTSSGGDSYDVYSITLNVEAWIKATPQEGPSVAFKRAARIIDAIHLSFNKSPTLNGLVLNLTRSPQAAISPIVTKDLKDPNVALDNIFSDELTDNFNGYYLCGGGVIYNVLKNTSI